jgi:hypothetical protein
MLVTRSFPFLRGHVAGKTCSFWPERYVFKTCIRSMGRALLCGDYERNSVLPVQVSPFSVPVTFLSRRCVPLCPEDTSSKFFQKVGTRPLNCSASRPEGFNILIFPSSFFSIFILFCALITRNNKIRSWILTLIIPAITRRRFSQLVVIMLLWYKRRVQLKCDGTRWRTGGEVKGKLANGVGSQFSSRYLGTWCIQHYYRWCAHLGYQ